MSLRTHVLSLRKKHQTLEQKIADERKRPAPDSLVLQALRKQKLNIKETITREEALIS